MKQTIRIIGGQFRGKKLHFPATSELRPTPDRVRETLFNWLMHDIRDARCLDAFAGSGALGFEAYSRGAAFVVMVEQDPQTFNNLQQHVKTFNSPQLSAVKGDALSYLQQTNDTFDIVFLDPPFAKNYYAPCLKLLENSNRLVSGGLLYIESGTRETPTPGHWEVIKLKQSGQVVYGLYKKL